MFRLQQMALRALSSFLGFGFPYRFCSAHNPTIVRLNHQLKTLNQVMVSLIGRLVFYLE
jgi:hypothetical protein